MCNCCDDFPTGCLSPLCLNGKEQETNNFYMTVDVILQEIQIRIDKLTEFAKEQEKKDPELYKTIQIRYKEYESFKQWIEIRK